VQLDVLNAQVQLLTAQSTRLQALFGYNSSLAEFDRATGAQSTYSEMSLTSRPARRKRKPTIPAVARTRKENQNTLTIARCEIRLDDPELHIPNKLKSEISDRFARRFWDFTIVTFLGWDVGFGA